MKKTVYPILLMLFLLGIPTTGKSQYYPVKKVNGIEYYVYTVEIREGFYALFRKFGISEEEVIKHNPETKSGLKVGQQVLIPVRLDESPHPTPASSGENYLQHLVEKQQTLYSISRKYHVSMDAIRALNPQIGKDNKLQEGDVLKIPKKASSQNTTATSTEPAATPAPAPKATPAPDPAPTPAESDSSDSPRANFTEHTVNPQETLYSISRLYNIFVEDIINANPNLESKLKIGQVIRIPKGSSYSEPQQPETAQDTEIPPVATEENSQANHTNDHTRTKPKEVLRIAFLLPFMTEGGSDDKNVERFMDFYAGALLAIEEAKNRGVSLEIQTYDTDKTEEKIQEVLRNPTLSEANLIIGPAYSNHISSVTTFAKALGIKTIIPFSSHINDINTNPYIFQFNPGPQMELNYMMQALTGKYRHANIIFVDVDDNSSNGGALWTDNLFRALQEKGKNPIYWKWRDPNSPEIERVLKRNANNLVFFKTHKFALVKPYLKTMQSIKPNFNITLFAQYGWTMLPLKVNSIHLSPFRKDFNMGKLKAFEEKFANFFDWQLAGTQPRYDLLGYDITSFFVTQLLENKDKSAQWKNKLHYQDGIQSQFQFERNDDTSGYVNQRIYLVETEAQQ